MPGWRQSRWRATVRAEAACESSVPFARTPHLGVHPSLFAGPASVDREVHWLGAWSALRRALYCPSLASLFRSAPLRGCQSPAIWRRSARWEIMALCSPHCSISGKALFIRSRCRCRSAGVCAERPADSGCAATPASRDSRDGLLLARRAPKQPVTHQRAAANEPGTSPRGDRTGLRERGALASARRLPRLPGVRFGSGSRSTMAGPRFSSWSKMVIAANPKGLVRAQILQKLVCVRSSIAVLSTRD